MSLPQPCRPSAPAVFCVGPFDVYDDGVRVALHGELDLASAPELATGIALLTRPPAGGSVAPLGQGTVLLDISALTFLDSAGLAALTDAYDMLSAAGWRVRLSPPPPAVRRLLDHAVTAGWFPIGLSVPSQPAGIGTGPGQGPA